MKLRFTEKDTDFWSEALIALSQVTFGVFWASMFLPIEKFKIYVIITNGIATAIILLTGWFIKRRKL